MEHSKPPTNQKPRSTEIDNRDLENGYDYQGLQGEHERKIFEDDDDIFTI